MSSAASSSDNIAATPGTTAAGAQTATCSPTPSQVRPAPPRPRLAVKAHTRISPRLHEYLVASPAMERTLGVRVLLPTGYDKARTRYPVLFALHGGFGSFRSITETTDIERFTAGRDLIVVMPEGGQLGWYVDWFNQGSRGTPRWETFMGREVVAWVDAAFRTMPDRNHRWVTGYSMGGFGTGVLMTRMPDVFGMGALHSGITQPTGQAMGFWNPLGAAVEGDPVKSLFGTPDTEEITYIANSAWALAENMQHSYVDIRAGDGKTGAPGGTDTDYSEAAADDQAIIYASRLTELGFDHDLAIYPEGTHDAEHAQRYLHASLPILLERGAALDTRAPSSFNYTSGESHVTVYGWEVTMHRAVQELVELQNVTSSGLRIVGSGRADVLTPPVLRPGKAYAVQVNGKRRAVHRADSRGRLGFTVAVGPEHRFNQFSSAQTRLQEMSTEPYMSAVTVALTPCG